MKLDHLLRTGTLKAMLGIGLFPTFKELLSLNLEYGIPLSCESALNSDLFPKFPSLADLKTIERLSVNASVIQVCKI